MRKLKLIFLVIVTALIVLLIGLSTVTAAAPEKGLTFNADNGYQITSNPTSMPKTFESTVYFPKGTSISQRGGVIFSNYVDDQRSGISFEVTKVGIPRIYIVIGTKVYDCSFSQVNMYSYADNWTHIAVTMDFAKGNFYCYINGELKQTVSKSGISSFAPTNEFYLGGDMRQGNKEYLKGYMKDFAFYSDIRTAPEIANDYNNSVSDDDNLLGYYDFSELATNEQPQKLICKYKKGINFTLVQRWIRDKEAITDYSYSMAVLGDTQSLVYHYPDKVHILYDWLVANKESKNIQFVFGLGDITDKSSADEWNLITTQIHKLDGVVPYSLVRGNHDKINDYKRYLPYNQFESSLSGSYEANMLNTYQEFTVNKIKYLVINLDLILSDAAIEWAGKIAEEHPEHNIIVTTHIYMYDNGGYYNLSNLKEKYDCQNNGEDLWNDLLSQHKNIVMLICGHNPTDLVYVKQSSGKYGNKVTQMLVDPQNMDEDWEATGMVAMLYFSADGKNVDVEYYSTVKDAYYLPSNQFSFKLNVIKNSEMIETEPVTEEPDETGNTGGTSDSDSDNIIIIAVIAGIVVIATVVLVVFYSKKKNKKD